METGLDCFKKALRLGPVDAGQYSPLALAYIGDAVYELIIRTMIMNRGNVQVNKMHRRTAALVMAGAQADLYRRLEPDLTEAERAVYRRGRNAKSATMPRHATMKDYRTATGLEALVGYLYLTEQFERLAQLMGLGLERLGAISPAGEETEAPAREEGREAEAPAREEGRETEANAPVREEGQEAEAEVPVREEEREPEAAKAEGAGSGGPGEDT